MISFKAKLINFIIIHRHLLQGKLRKEVFDFNTSIEAFREQCERGADRLSSLPEGVGIREEFIAGIKSEWLIPAGAEPEKVIMYVHGGGYVSGSCHDHRALISNFAKNTGVATLLYEYRLAPEDPFPAALDDSVKIYKWLLDAGKEPENILLAGESAGGGLCLALLLALKENKIPLPSGAVAISPWVDLTCSGESYKTKNSVSAAQLNSWTVFSKYYCGENNPDYPLISPLFGELHGLPPLFINSAVDDELYDEGEKFCIKAKNAGVDVTFRAGAGMLHCYPLMAPMFREATEAMNEIVAFIRSCLSIV